MSNETIFGNYNSLRVASLYNGLKLAGVVNLSRKTRKSELIRIARKFYREMDITDIYLRNRKSLTPRQARRARKAYRRSLGMKGIKG